MRLFTYGGKGWRLYSGISNNNGVNSSGSTNGHNVGGTYVVLALVVGLLVTMVTGARDGGGEGGGGGDDGGGGDRRPRDAGVEKGAGTGIKERQHDISPSEWEGEREMEQVVQNGDSAGTDDDTGVHGANSNDIMLDLNKLARLGNKDKLLSMLKQIADSIHKCGIKEVPPLKRHFITNQTVTCNDGSPAG